MRRTLGLDVVLLALISSLIVVTACNTRRAAPPAGKPLAVAPVSRDPRLVELAVEPTADKVLADKVAELAVRIRVSASKLPPGERPPLNLTLLLDTSGSMDGKAIDEARAAAQRMVDRLTPHDRVALVVFHSIGEVLVQSTPVTLDARKQIAKAIAGIRAHGTTDMATGLGLALNQALAGRTPGSIDRIVFLGDGVPNDPVPLPGLIAQAQAQHLQITTLGLGVDFDDALLGKIASDTGGRYHYLDAPDQVAAVFDDELLQMRHVIGKNLTLNLVAGPGVTLEPMAGFQPLANGMYAVLGDLSAGEIRDVIVPLHVVGRHDGATVELMDATLSFEDAAANAGGLQRSGFASVKSDADPSAVQASVKVTVEASRARAAAAAAIIDAIAHARSADLAGAQKLLDDAEAAARKTAAATGDAELIALADRMVDLRKDLPEIARAAQVMIVPGGGGADSVKMPSPAPAEVEMRVRRVQEHANNVMRGSR